jgi:hypothetical protein
MQTNYQIINCVYSAVNVNVTMILLWGFRYGMVFDGNFDVYVHSIDLAVASKWGQYGILISMLCVGIRLSRGDSMVIAWYSRHLLNLLLGDSTLYISKQS